MTPAPPAPKSASPSAGTPLTPREALRDVLRRWEPAAGPDGFEGLVAQALAALSGYTFRLATSGSQFGRDAAMPNAPFAIAMEAKRYTDRVPLEALVGKASVAAFALANGINVWVLAATVEVSDSTQRVSCARKILPLFDRWNGNAIGEPPRTLSVMREFSADEMKSGFLAWQCRIRQIAMREYGGQPTPGMRPRVLRPSGECLVPAMTVLILHDDPDESTVFFRFQVQKTLDPHNVYQSVLSYLQGEHYQVSDRFSDEMTALFEPDSPTAAKLVKARRCLLEFAQFSQVWRLSCSVRRLPAHAPAREATVWHNRAFNPAVPTDAVVLGFKPTWRSAAANPLPGV